MIRPAERRDCPEIWSLVCRLARYERLEHQLDGGPRELESALFDRKCAEALVAEEDGAVVGYALYFPTFSTFLARPGVWLEDLFVLPEWRGRGLGKALLSEVVRIARLRGAGRVEWSVLDWNEPAIRFYESLGARLLPDWRFCRLEGESLRRFGRWDPGPSAPTDGEGPA
ncbi:MAG: GNAT family N-acetyltransferase [Fimbriimonadales bacterium]|nr:GNAT family N-acetyltransferase [Fimbriimonadales bacterium]